MTPKLALGLDDLTNADNLKGFYVGKVVESGNDPQGRIKARIEALFGDSKKGIKDSDLPWIQMMPSCGLYVRPQKGDFVTVIFMGSIYEGFYVGHTVHANSKSENSAGGTFGSKLNNEFFLNFHKSFMRGKYDGSEFEVNINNGQIKIKTTDGINLDIETKGGNVNLNPTGMLTTNKKTVIPDRTGGPWCGLPQCILVSAIPHQGNKAI